MSHTPGPWQTKDIGHGHCICPDVAWVGLTSKQPREETAANARLIAAAPELLETLEGLHKALARMIDKHEPDSKEAEWLQHSHEAICNAKGRKP